MVRNPAADFHGSTCLAPRGVGRAAGRDRWQAPAVRSPFVPSVVQVMPLVLGECSEEEINFLQPTVRLGPVQVLPEPEGLLDV